MSLESDIIAELAADPFIIARCGNRVSAEWRAQGSAVPALVVQRVASQTVQHLEGRSLSEVLLQINVFAGSYEATKELAEYVRDLYDGAQRTIGTTRVADCRRNNEGDLSSIDGDRDSRQAFIDFGFLVQE